MPSLVPGTTHAPISTVSSTTSAACWAQRSTCSPWYLVTPGQIRPRVSPSRAIPPRVPTSTSTGNTSSMPRAKTSWPVFARRRRSRSRGHASGPSHRAWPRPTARRTSPPCRKRCRDFSRSSTPFACGLRSTTAICRISSSRSRTVRFTCCRPVAASAPPRRP